jgi:hypothetical protein
VERLVVVLADLEAADTGIVSSRSRGVCASAWRATNRERATEQSAGRRERMGIG